MLCFLVIESMALRKLPGEKSGITPPCGMFWVPVCDPAHPTCLAHGGVDSCLRRWYQDTSRILQEGSLALPVERRM